MRKIICIIVCISIIINNSILLKAESISGNSDETLNFEQILLDAGTPEEVIAGFSTEQKEFIVNNLEHESVYEGNDITYIINASNNTLGRAVSVLPEELMSISVTCYSITVSGGEKQYQFFPTFKWKSVGYNIKNDTFAFSLYSGWEVVPESTAQLNIHLKNQTGVTQQTALYEPYCSFSSGYSFCFTHGWALPTGYHEGYGLFYARKKDSNATNGMSVKYVHDNSPNCNISYGLSYKVGAIYVSSDDDEIQVYSKNLSFTYK